VGMIMVARVAGFQAGPASRPGGSPSRAGVQAGRQPKPGRRPGRAAAQAGPASRPGGSPSRAGVQAGRQSKPGGSGRYWRAVSRASWEGCPGFRRPAFPLRPGLLAPRLAATTSLAPSCCYNDSRVPTMLWQAAPLPPLPARPAAVLAGRLPSWPAARSVATGRSRRPGAPPARRSRRPGAPPAGRSRRPGAPPAGRSRRPGAPADGHVLSAHGIALDHGLQIG
jgi:hypothetical protein